MNYGQLDVRTMDEECPYKKFRYFHKLLKTLNMSKNDVFRF